MMKKTRYGKWSVCLAAAAALLTMTAGMKVSAEDTDIQKNGTQKAPSNIICSVDGVGYSSLREAVDAVSGSGAVVLEKDITNLKTADIVTIPEGKDVTFDMAGKSIAVDSADFDGRVFVNRGSLTITGNGTIDTTGNIKGLGPVENYGTLTIENGTYKGSRDTNAVGIWNRAGGTAYFKGGSYENFPTVIRTAFGSTTVISGGIYTNDLYPAIDNDGEMTITGGTFKNTSCSSCDSVRWGYTVRNGIGGQASHLVIEEAAAGSVSITGVQGALANSCGLLEVKSGSFETIACAVHGSGPSHYALYVAGERGDSKAVVTGGTFRSVSKTAVLVGNDNTNGDGGINANATTEIKGGTFIAPEGEKAVTGAPKTGNPSVTGGTFSSDVSEYIPEGAEVVPNEDGSFDVHVHQIVYVEGTKADCTQDGYGAHWECTECKKYFQDEKGETEIDPDSIKEAAKGHTLQYVAEKKATEKEAGNKAYWFCSVCGGYFFDEEGKEATTLEAVTTPALGVQKPGADGNSGTAGQNGKTPDKNNGQLSQAVQTGDSAHPVLWIVLAALAVGTVVCVAFVRRHKR